MSFFQLAPALIGLLGVLVGAAATSGVTYLVDHSRNKGEERGAERLVLAEVLSNDGVVWSTLPARRTRLSDAAWRAERERLARSLSNAEWAWVAKYYRDLAKIKSRNGKLDLLKRDNGCTLAALNVWEYQNSQYDQELRKRKSCTKLPGKL